MKYLLFVSIIVSFNIVVCAQEDVKISLVLGKLTYLGNDNSKDQITDKLYYAYPRKVNYSDNPTYVPKYPNPFSPSMIPVNSFLLYDTSSVKIELLNDGDRTILSFISENNPPGYYSFLYNHELNKIDSLYNHIYENKLRIIINGTIYILPLTSK